MSLELFLLFFLVKWHQKCAEKVKKLKKLKNILVDTSLDNFKNFEFGTPLNTFWGFSTKFQR